MKSLLNLAMIASVVGMMFACTNDTAVSPAGEVGGGSSHDPNGQITETKITGHSFARTGNKVTFSYTVKRSTSTQLIKCGFAEIEVTYSNGSKQRIKGKTSEVNSGSLTFNTNGQNSGVTAVAYYIPSPSSCNLIKSESGVYGPVSK
jgi:hypothetical protein